MNENYLKMKAKYLKLNKKYIIILIIIVSFFSCAKEEHQITGLSNNVAGLFETDTLSIAAINSRIEEISKSKGEFNWTDGTTQMLWSAIVNSGNVVTIGYGEDISDFENRKTLDQKQIKEQLKQIVLDSEGAENSRGESKEMFLDEDEDINFIDIIIHKRETFVSLLKQKNIRYIEPANYIYENQERVNTNSSVIYSSGCGSWPEVLSKEDYTIITPNAKVPWNFYEHNIPEAWEYSTGSGITIGIIDTGLSPDQSLMDKDFNNGLSQGRTIEKRAVYVDSYFPWATTVDGFDDLCGHGTKMAAIAAAPRNNIGFPVGVAYNANLIVYRASSGVYLGGYQSTKGVQKAFVELAKNNKVNIISMSMGDMGIIPNSKIRDAVKYAYNKGKLIFCAGGTSYYATSLVYGVIFPASMDEVVAVTGVKEGKLTKSCDVCHSGKQIDFTVVMERLGTNKNVPVLGMKQEEEQYVGGSSVSTATMAGVAALVWAKNPTWTREQVLDKLKKSASLYPSRDPQFGYGKVDVLAAVK